MLDKRLQAVADKVRPGKRLADIGTDHAYLPVDLVSRGITPFAIACDLREGPLQNACRTVAEAGLADRIQCRLGNGLSPLSAGEVEDIVIAGMGGETVASILSACLWAKNKHLHFVFQPMTRSEDLRRYLLTEGYVITAETTLQHGGHLYVIIEAEWTDAPPVIDEAAYVLGRLDGTRDREWLLWQKDLLTKRLKGMQTAGNTDEITRLTGILQRLEERL